MAYDESDTEGQPVADGAEQEGKNPPISPEDELLVKRIRARIAADQKHHEEAFKRMRRDMTFARIGSTEQWKKSGNYTANITGRHIKQLVSTLYAKNPKAVARRRERLDFQIWDEDEQSLLAAMEIVQQFQMATAPMVGSNVVPMMQPMVVPPEVLQAQALIQDFQAGMQERTMVDKIGKTLVVLFDYFMREQKPLDFKAAMKQMVRRTATTCVGYVELGFQRAYGQNDLVTSQIADVRGQLNHIQSLIRETQEGGEYGADEDKAKLRELEISLESLQQQEYFMLREGLVFDFPESTRVIPDKRCRNLVGFVGARWVTVEYFYTPEEVCGLFGIDVGKGYTPYSQEGKKLSDDDQYRLDIEGQGEKIDNDGLACVYKHYDRAAGVVYYVCDGYKGFLRPPAAPDIYVEDFWPIYALVFNAGEDPDCLFPPSDVGLLIDMQEEYNRSRQGKREHRRAARPRHVTYRGTFDDEEKRALSNAEPFSVTELNRAGENADIERDLQVVPVPGVDPNLYEVSETYTDMQLVVGTSPSQVGGTPRGETATGEALAEDSRALSAGSNIDDLDGFLTIVARAAGQILLREMSGESVQKIAGRGAVWPEMTLEDIAGEVYLEVEAGSTGKPNAAQEIRNWREMLPFLLQMPGIEPTWLARESLRRLDDRLDLTDAIAQGLPSIMMMNRTGGAQMGSDPGAAPDQQGGEGGGNGAPAPSSPAGGERGMGANNLG